MDSPFSVCIFLRIPGSTGWNRRIITYNIIFNSIKHHEVESSGKYPECGSCFNPEFNKS